MKKYFNSLKGLDLNKPSNRFIASLLVCTLKIHQRPKEIKRLGLNKEEIIESEVAIDNARN